MFRPQLVIIRWLVLFKFSKLTDLTDILYTNFLFLISPRNGPCLQQPPPILVERTM